MTIFGSSFRDPELSQLGSIERCLYRAMLNAMLTTSVSLALKCWTETAKGRRSSFWFMVSYCHDGEGLKAGRAASVELGAGGNHPYDCESVNREVWNQD